MIHHHKAIIVQHCCRACRVSIWLKRLLLTCLEFALWVAAHGMLDVSMFGAAKHAHAQGNSSGPRAPASVS